MLRRNNTIDRNAHECFHSRHQRGVNKTEQKWHGSDKNWNGSNSFCRETVKFYPFRVGSTGAYGPVRERIKLHCFFAKTIGTVSVFVGSVPFLLCRVKAGFHMIADDRGSQIADRRSQKVLRSSAIIWKHTSAIACDPAIVIADDRRRSQKIEPCSIFCDRLRSSAIVCDPAIIWKPKFCDLRSKCIP